MAKAGNNVIQRWVLELNPQYEQKSQTVYVNNKGKLCMYYGYNK